MIRIRQWSGIGHVHRQKGAALLILITGLLAITAYMTLEVTSANRSRLEHQKEVTRSLGFAKDALIAYAVNYVDNYGHNTRGGVGRLPCPSRSRYGSPARTCGRNAIGFLPGVWTRDGKRIDIDHLEKYLQKDFWYSVSPDFRYNPAFNVLNSNISENLFRVNDDEEIVAVIIAPGTPLAGQSRSIDEFSVSDYLEGENADSDAVYSSGTSGNDQLVTIRRSELLPLIEQRVLGYVRDWLLEYKELYGSFPYAAAFDDPLAECQQGLTRGKLAMVRGNCTESVFGELVSEYVPRNRAINQTWFNTSDWPDFIFYQVDENCTLQAESGICDLDDAPLSLMVNDLPAQVLLVSVGEPIATELLPQGQQRNATGESMVNYFDTAELVDSEIEYDLRRLESTVLPGTLSNDQFQVIWP